MQTHSGRQFYPLDPQAEDIDMSDIAHALSMICRFGGHVREFYSVAQHSLIVSMLLPPWLKLAGLLHDATEAYLVDIPRPLKNALPEYKAIEAKLSAIIAQKYGVDFSDPLIKRADNIALMTEARDLLGPQPDGWGVGESASPFLVVPMTPQEAKREFIKEYIRLAA